MPFIVRRRVVLGVLAAGLVPVAAVSTAIAATKSSKVTLTEFKVAASPKSVSAGRITFTVKNAGGDEHEVIVIKTSTPASKLKVSGGRASTKGQVAKVKDIAGGKSKTLRVTLKKGHYVLICNLPGHYQQGMRSDLTVK